VVDDASRESTIPSGEPACTAFATVPKRWPAGMPVLTMSPPRSLPHVTFGMPTFPARSTTQSESVDPGANAAGPMFTFVSDKPSQCSTPAGLPCSPGLPLVTALFAGSITLATSPTPTPAPFRSSGKCRRASTAYFTALPPRLLNAGGLSG